MFQSVIKTNSSDERIINNQLLKPVNFNSPDTPAPKFNLKSEICNINDDAMKIYLRLRPMSNSSLRSPYTLNNDFTVTANPPEQSLTYKNLLHGYGKGCQKFSFSKVFMGNSNQEMIFSETAQMFIDDFRRGSDRLLFTYGTTSSGKTFTMNGGKSNIGIIPRALIQLFQSSTLSNNPSVMPVDFCEVCHLKAADVQKIEREKSILLKSSEKETSDLLNIFDEAHLDDVISDMSITDSNYETTFWISYTEIYNEMIYDLLDPNTANSSSQNTNKFKRPILDIRAARSGGSYVRGLKSYPVYSAEEAFRLLLVGRRAQNVGATRLNQNSSRSHTIFTIRAVRSMPDSEYLSRVVNFSFCDLAGSERTDKAGTTGLALKEANNINSSLLALGRCIEVLRQNSQSTNGPGTRIVPYRDSKLTRLFQTYLGGNGRAAMIVCVNPDPALFDESLQVLKFSALARKVVLYEKERPADIVITDVYAKDHSASFIRRFQIPGSQDEGHDFDEDEDCDDTLEGEDSEEMEETYDVEELLDIIERLKAELIATRKAKVADEVRLRETINDEWSKTIMEMERDNAKNVQRIRNEMQEKVKQKARQERHKAYRQLKRRKLQPEFELVELEEEESQESEENEENGNSSSTLDESAEKVEPPVCLKRKLRQVRAQLESREQQCFELRERVKACEEEVADALERADIATREQDRLQVECQELRFRLSMSISGPAADPALGSVPERATRFSVITRNPAIAAQRAPGSVSHSNAVRRQSRKKASAQDSPAKKKPLFKIFVDDSEESATNISFEQCEAECQQLELEDQLSRLRAQYDSRVHEMQAQIDEMTDKLTVREKCVSRLTDKENSASRRLDGILQALVVDTAEQGEALRVKDKLRLVSRAVQTMLGALDEVCEASGVRPAQKHERALSDISNERVSPKFEIEAVLQHIRELDQKVLDSNDRYKSLVNLFNEWVVEQARQHLNLKIRRFSADMDVDDLSSRFRKFWKVALERVSSLTNQLEQDQSANANEDS